LTIRVATGVSKIVTPTATVEITTGKIIIAHRCKIDYLDWTSADYPDGQKKIVRLAGSLKFSVTKYVSENKKNK
jgi:hypothetical protein